MFYAADTTAQTFEEQWYILQSAEAAASKQI